jgi:hypothetical protein
MSKSIALSKEYIIGTMTIIELQREMPEAFIVRRILMNPIITMPHYGNNFMVAMGGWFVKHMCLGQTVIKDDDGELEECSNYSPLSSTKMKLDQYMKKGEQVSISILYQGFVPKDYCAGISTIFSVTLRGIEY